MNEFVILSEVVSDVILEIRYYSTYNFVGERIDGYEEPIGIITRDAANALKEVSDELVSKGYRLKIYDAYRPQKAVTSFIKWSRNSDERMRPYFYPQQDKLTLFERGYIAEKSSHSRGSTIDVTLVDMTTGKEVDMGGTFDYFGEISHSNYQQITDEQYQNRKLLRDTMVKYGFLPIQSEWWHFTLEKEPFPNTYFDFPVSKNSIK